jgi:uncharacterized repeat protein (TIGR01451 family)
MIRFGRFFRGIFLSSMVLLFALVFWLWIPFASSQNTIPVAALQEQPTTSTDTSASTPTDTPSNTPTPTLSATPPATLTATPTGELTVDETVDAKLVNDLNGNNRFDPGDTVRYIINLANPGKTNLTNVQVIDDYDQTAISDIARITDGGVNEKGIITWTIENFPANQNQSISYEATFNNAFSPQGTRRVENQVRVSSNQTDVVSAISAIDVMVPGLTVAKVWQLVGDMNVNGQPDPGDRIKYTITVDNVGDIEASEILIQDDYDERLLEQLGTISDGGVNTEQGGVLRWELDRLDARQQKYVTYDIAVLPGLPLGKSTVNNTVTVSSDGTLPITAEKSFEVEVIPTPSPTVEASAPTSGPASQSAGPTSQAISPVAQAWLALGFILAAMAGLISFAYLTHKERAIPNTLRDGYILTLIMGTVIILGLAGSVERSAIAGLIGTVAGYVLRSVAGDGGKGG